MNHRPPCEATNISRRVGLSLVRTPSRERDIMMFMMIFMPSHSLPKLKIDLQRAIFNVKMHLSRINVFKQEVRVEG